VSTSVIVVSYRVHGWLERCLESVTGQADEVLLVDNGSPGGAVGAIGRRCGVTVETLGANRGFAAGVNAGLRRVRGDLVALLNDDAVAEPGWLASAAKVLADPTVGAVGPKILFPSRFAEIRLDEEPHYAPPDPRALGRTITRVELDGRPVPLGSLRGAGLHELEHEVGDGVERHFRWTAGSGPILIPLEGDAPPAPEVAVDGQPVPLARTVDVISCAGVYLSTEGHAGDYGFEAPDDGSFDQPAEHFAASGAAMVARAETFARLGGLAESFFAYYEDVDWCWRARLAGLRILYEPAGVVRHVGGASTGGPSNERVRVLAARNRIRTLAHNAPLPVLWREVRSPVDRPKSGMMWPLASAVVGGLVGRRRLRTARSGTPMDVWREWAGRDEAWRC